MPRKRGIKQNFNFVKGWNTEASPMTFPENTAKDLDNVVLDVDGSIRRRMGVVCESATSTRYFQKTKAQYDNPAIGFFKWENVGGSGNVSVLVSQFGTTLQLNGEDGTDYGQVDFSGQVVAARASEAPNEVVSVASGLGYLFVTGPSINPFYLVADLVGATASLVSIDINIRDFDGADDGLAVDDRPTTLSAAHEYNLRNQGWPTNFQLIDNTPTKSDGNPYEYTFTELGYYPSNADVLYLGKTATGTDEDEIGRYNPYTMIKNVFGTTPAARGKYIYNPFNINRDGIVAGAGTEQISNRPRAVGFHNGRVFYAGVNATGFTGKVYYSQQLTDIDKVGKCYQQNDPTAEEFNDLLATDGGEIDIPNCGNILRLEEGPAGIVVFASNGMWEITGTEGKFSATDFFVRKITDIGCVSAESVVNADGTFFYFSDAGIVGTQRDQVSGNLSADVITQTSIQLGYLLFGGPQRRGARGTWIRGEKKVVWLYSTDSTYDGVNSRFKYNGVLILDTILGAFYKYSISDFNVGEAPYVSGIVESSNTVSATVQEDVTVGGVTVTAGGADVTIGVAGASADTLTSTWKLQVVRPTVVGTTIAWGIDFATFASRTFTDWYFEDNVGADYTSYLETGYDYGGEAMFEKRPTYVYTYMSRVSKSNATGGFYNIPDPTTAVIIDASYNECVYDPTTVGTLSAAGTGGTIHSKVTFSPDGTRCIVPRLNGNNLFNFTLSTPYDFRTEVEVANAQFTGNCAGRIRFSPDGTEAWGLSEVVLGDLYHFTGLTTPYVIEGTTLTPPKVFDWGNWVEDFMWSQDGLTMWVLRPQTITGGASNLDCQLEKWVASVAFDATTLTYVEDIFDFNAEFSSGIAQSEGIPNPAARSMDYSLDGTQLYIMLDDALDLQKSARMYIFDLAIPYDIDTLIWTGDYIDMARTLLNNLNANQQVHPGDQLEWGWWREDLRRLYYTRSSIYPANHIDENCDLCGTPGLIEGQTRTSFGPMSLGSTVQQMRVVDNGTKMLVLEWDAGALNSYLVQYNLSTPYDITTATLGTNSGVLTTTNTPIGLAVNDTGNAFIIVDQNTSPDTLRLYRMGTAYDASTASLHSSWTISNASNVEFINDSSILVYDLGGSGSLERYSLPAGLDLGNNVDVLPTLAGTASPVVATNTGFALHNGQVYLVNGGTAALTIYDYSPDTVTLVDTYTLPGGAFTGAGMEAVTDGDGVIHMYWSGSNSVYQAETGC